MSSNLQIEQQAKTLVRSDQTNDAQISLKSSTAESSANDAPLDVERAVTIVEKNDEAKAPLMARDVRLEKRGPPFSRLEREAQMDVFIDNETEKIDRSLAKQKLANLFNTGTTTLIVAGVVAIALAALFIWPAAVAVGQSKRLNSFENPKNSALAKQTDARPQTGTAHVMAILTAIVGALGTLVALGSTIAGLGALSFGVVLSVAMLVIGIIAAHRLGAQQASETNEAIRTKKAGRISLAASALWITAVVLGLAIPGILSIAVGAGLKLAF